MEDDQRKFDEQSKLLQGRNKELSKQDGELKNGKRKLDEQTKVAARSQAAAERLNARAEVREQAVATIASIGEDTRTDALALIAALKRGVDHHRTIEEHALSAVPALLQASLNRRTLRYDAPLTGIGADPDNSKLLAATSGGAVRFPMCDANRGGVVEKKAFRLCLDKGAERLIVSTPPEDDKQGCKIVSWPTAVAAGKGAEEVLVGFPKGRVFLWNWDNGKITPVPGHRYPVANLEFSDDAKSSVSTSVLWSFSVASLGDPPRRFYRKPGIIDWFRVLIGGGRTELVRSVRFLGAADLLAIGFEDGRIELWSASRHKRFASQRIHWDAVLSLASHGPGSQLLSTGRDGLVCLWKVEHTPGKDPRLVDNQRLQSQTGDFIGALTSAFESSGSMFALGFGNGSVQLWDARTRKSLLEIPAHSGRVNAIRFLSHDLLVSASDDGAIRTWRVPSENEMTTLLSLIGTINAAQLSTDASMQLSDEQARCWNSVLEKSETFLWALEGDATRDGGQTAFKSGS
jgi:WD40 repeat protein